MPEHTFGKYFAGTQGHVNSSFGKRWHRLAGRRRSGLVAAMNWNGIEERIRRNRKGRKELRNRAGVTERNEQSRRNGTERRIQEIEYK